MLRLAPGFGTLAAVVGLATVARADVVVTHSGYLLGPGDVPVEAPALPVQFAIFASDTGGAAAWTGSCTVAVRAGYYTARLGGDCGPALPDAVVAGTQYLEITADSVVLTPRLAIDRGGGVASFNGRFGAIALSTGDVTGALGFTPLASAVTTFNGRSGAVALSGTDVTDALGFSPIGTAVTTLNGRAGAVTIGASDVTGGLGFTPLDAAGGVISGTLGLGIAPAAGTKLQVAGRTRTDTLTVGDYSHTIVMRVYGRGSSASDDLFHVADLDPANYDSGGATVEICGGSRWAMTGCATYLVAAGHSHGRDGNSAGESYSAKLTSSSVAIAQALRVSWGPGPVNERPLRLWIEASSATNAYLNAFVRIEMIGSGTLTAGSNTVTSKATVSLLTVN